MNKKEAVPFGRYFEDFQVGAIYHHRIRKTITESDNNLFCLITMNHHPAHLDLEYAQDSQHGNILVVGTLIFSLVVGLTVADISGRAIANLMYENINHDGPVFIGDTIHANTEIIEINNSRTKNDRGIIKVKTCAYNQDDKLILTFSRKVLVPKQNV